MHCVQLADLGGILAIHGTALLQDSSDLTTSMLHDYWVSSRGRVDAWNRALATIPSVDAGDYDREIRAWWLVNLPLVHEVLVSDILTRVYGGMGAVLDARSNREEVGPITQGVQRTHLEQRNRVLRLLVDGRGLEVHSRQTLNRLRGGVERWADALLGHLAAECEDAVEFGFESDRVRSHAQQTKTFTAGRMRQTAGWLLATSMHDALVRSCARVPANPVANRRIAKSVLKVLRPDLFDALGEDRDLWLHRLKKQSRMLDRVLCDIVSADLDAGDTWAGFQEMRHGRYSSWA
ncbi:MAG: hypothetical protein AAFN70_01245 [Planctomycetota bacterium]